MSDTTQPTISRRLVSPVVASTIAAMGARGTHCAPSTGSGSTAFARLSPAAQGLIVNALMGEYDESGPPKIPPEVAAEIKAWVETPKTPNVKSETRR